jgi:hypothetical protein
MRPHKCSAIDAGGEPTGRIAERNSSLARWLRHCRSWTSAYEAAAAIGLNADSLAGRGKWTEREPFVNECGKQSFHLRRLAALLPPNQSPRLELEEASQAVANMTGEGTTRELLERWRAIDPSIIAAREAIANDLRALHLTGTLPPRSALPPVSPTGKRLDAATRRDPDVTE